MIEAIPQTDGNTHASGAELSTTPNTLYARWLVSENGMDPSAHIKEVSAWTTVNLSGKPAVFDVPVVRDYTYRTASDMLMRDVEASVSGPIGMADDGRDSLIVISPVHPNPTQPLGIIIRGKNGSHFLGTIDSDNKVTMNRTPSGVIQIGEGARVTVFET